MWHRLLMSRQKAKKHTHYSIFARSDHASERNLHSKSCEKQSYLRGGVGRSLWVIDVVRLQICTIAGAEFDLEVYPLGKK